MTNIKICGINDIPTMELCHALNVNWTGFIFHPSSPRFVSPEQAAILHASIPDMSKNGPARVGLFVEPSDEILEKTLGTVPLNILQIYASFNRALEIKKRFKLPVWHARGISSSEDLPVSKDINGYVIEAPKQSGDTRPGGLGRTFDWSLISHWNAPSFWMLAGGLTPNNVQDAIKTCTPPAVDVSSGVEDRPGHKSPILIKDFVKKVRERA
ncbi:phosphoribosylanthranilate isomerase [Swingsia samuiensis]|uniref:N-(5'-phosphoribosyl)anthranilate isomerase n=1 Tax=Swingsia samuiensis TaxID=1293412 RepID=A0A4Y6UL35_9PROT|nr:phosphoribosylanthranilate isomerase [Swingsia samuiensis]QDH17784.1 phosphoribosylanthranilate isomerase [Swingsia samuiensis]